MDKNPVNFSCEIQLAKITEILPSPKSAIQKILLLLLSRKTTSSGLGF